MPSEPAKPKPNTSIAVEQLRSLIFEGKLAAGSDHLESELAQALGMSRTPIREALLILETQGLVDVRPRKGVRIRPVSADDMAEIYDVLTELESLAAADAAAKKYSDADLSVLSAAINRMDRALAEDDRRAWALADEAFHSELVRLGGNSRVENIVALMSDQVRRARLVTLFIRPVPTKSNDDHRGVLEAIRRGDPKTAHRIHHDHRTAAKTILIDLLDRHSLNHL